MDILEKYIKMCEKATEIQKNKPWLEAGDFCRNPYSGKSHAIGGKVERTDLIWLPRQDQLQEMIIGKDKKFRNHIHALNFFFDFEFDEEWNEKKQDYIIKYNSMEQLWLAFVMLEKYGKIWNESDWISKKLIDKNERR